MTAIVNTFAFSLSSHLELLAEVVHHLFEAPHSGEVLPPRVSVVPVEVPGG